MRDEQGEEGRPRRRNEPFCVIINNNIIHFFVHRTNAADLAKPMKDEDESVSRQAENSESTFTQTHILLKFAAIKDGLYSNYEPCPLIDHPTLSLKTTYAEIAFRLMALAEVHCKDQIDAYNRCAKGRSISMLWACKQDYDVSQTCLHN